MDKPPVEAGARVRIPSGPHAGEIGRIVSVHVNPGTYGAYYFGMVALEDGREAGVFDLSRLEIVPGGGDETDKPAT